MDIKATAIINGILIDGTGAELLTGATVLIGAEVIESRAVRGTV